MLTTIKWAAMIVWLVGGLVWVASGPTAAAPTAGTTPGLGGPAVAHPTSVKHVKIGKADCKDCHGDLVKQKNVHPPAADGCTTCHEYNETGEGAEIKQAIEGNDLCFTCHTEKQEDLKNKKFTHPPAEADCTTCHNPHSSDVSDMLKAPAIDLCFACHTDKQEEFNTKKFTHAPLKDLGCPTCHNPHASDVAPILKAEKNTICTSCHKLNAKLQRKAEGTFVAFGDTVVTAEYLSRAKKILLSPDGKGHPYVGHPVSGVADPSAKEKHLACTSCHNPHFGNYVQRFQKDLRGQALCDTCHKQQ
ncbi:MAG TPA: cytochrome c3 family protein [Blastocatellia bacterium]|nr:cytochrome c3 family protein [Blastocatellia bacterium]